MQIEICRISKSRFWEENEKWINFKNKTENLKSLSKYKTEKTEHSVLTDEICLSERKL